MKTPPPPLPCAHHYFVLKVSIEEERRDLEGERERGLRKGGDKENERGRAGGEGGGGRERDKEVKEMGKGGKER